MFVSILIPCYNARRWIGQAIESALAQTHPEKEVIVVDDGSTDGSREVIEEYAGRIRFESGPNRGGNAARNRLLELARGDWLQYLDADDYLLPDKIAAQIEYLTTQKPTDVLYGLVTAEDWTNGTVTTDLQRIPAPCDPWILLARWYLPQTGGPLWRKSALESAGGWNPYQPCCQEHELYLRLLMAGAHFTYCPINGAIYRIWSTATVCHRDAGETRKRRLDILEKAEVFLRSTGELDMPRLHAISYARFQMARMGWRENPDEAVRIVERLLESDPAFHPEGNQPGGHHPPLPYRLLWRGLGFRKAERIGDYKRRFQSGLRNLVSSRAGSSRS